MTFYQQDKHIFKVESSSLSLWIRNPRKQVQEAGGSSGEQDAAGPCVHHSTAPWGVDARNEGALQLVGAHLCNIHIAVLQRRGVGCGA